MHSNSCFAFDHLAHKAITAMTPPKKTATTHPGATSDDPAPLKGLTELVGVGADAPVPKVVEVGGATAAADALGVTVAATLFGAPGISPTDGLPVVPAAAVAVVKPTCGTVTTMLELDVVPLAVMIVEIVMAVCGTAGTIDETRPETVAVMAAAVLMGVGKSVIVVGTLVMIPGFWLT